MKTRFVKILGILFLIYALGWAIVQGYSVNWTGFGDFTNPSGEYIRGKTLWEWMELLVIPLFLAGGVYYLNHSERENERQRAEERSNLEREIATDRQQESALQSYFDQIAELLLKEKLRTTKRKDVRDLARIRTLGVLRELDGNRKGLLFRFLKEADLIEKEKSIVRLIEADLSHANLGNANDFVVLKSGSLNLDGANLRGANLSHAIWSESTFRFANLKSANLSHALFNDVNLSEANLSDANLNCAYLCDAILHNANLSGADLSGADLSYAKVSEKQLASAKSLKGAIMPDGSKHD